MHVDPIQTCFGFVIDRLRVLKAIYLKLLSIVVLASERFSYTVKLSLLDWKIRTCKVAIGEENYAWLWLR